jgi:hypothetical protein
MNKDTVLGFVFLIGLTVALVYGYPLYAALPY